MDANKLKLPPKEVFYHQDRSRALGSQRWVVCNEIGDNCIIGGRHITDEEHILLEVEDHSNAEIFPIRIGYYLDKKKNKLLVLVQQYRIKNGNLRERVFIVVETLIPPMHKNPSDYIKTSVPNAYNQLNIVDGVLKTTYITTPTLAGQLLKASRSTLDGRAELKLDITGRSVKDTYGLSRAAGKSKTYKYPNLAKFAKAKNAEKKYPFLIEVSAQHASKPMSFNSAPIVGLTCKSCGTCFNATLYYLNLNKIGCHGCLPKKSSFEEQALLRELEKEAKPTSTVASGPEATVTDMSRYGVWKSKYGYFDFLLNGSTFVEYGGWYDHNSIEGATRDADKSQIALDNGKGMIQIRVGNGKQAPIMLNLRHRYYREFDGTSMTPMERARKTWEIMGELEALKELELKELELKELELKELESSFSFLARKELKVVSQF